MVEPEPTTAPTPEQAIPIPEDTAEAAPSIEVAAQTVIEPFSAGVHRLAGSDRFATAVAISQRFAAHVPVVYVATGMDFPDALTAAAAAAQLGGPLLLTRADALPVPVRAEIVRLAPERVVVVGGESAVGAGVYDELAVLTPSISRSGEVIASRPVSC